MTLSLKRRSLSKPVRGNRVNIYDLGAIRARNKNKAHSYLLDIFAESGLSKAEIARMVGKKPEQITRWLSGPANLTLDTISDLVFVMKGETFTLQARDDLARARSNKSGPAWLDETEPSKWQEISFNDIRGGGPSLASGYITSSAENKDNRYEQYGTRSQKGNNEVA